MKKLFVAVLVFASVSCYSQGISSGSYSMGFGTGDLAEHTGTVSFRGFTVDFRKLVTPNVAVGIELGWNTFYSERSDDVYTIGNLSYSGKQYRYNNQFPMLVRADYYLKPGETVNPFFGLGLGTMFSMKATDMGQYRFEDEAWQFAMKPEFGIEYEVNPASALLVSVKYYGGFKGGDLPAQGYFTINVGMVFKN
jgi:outer membrane protein W